MGGYKIIKFKDVVFASGSQTSSSVHGVYDLYDRIKNSHKPVVISGLSVIAQGRRIYFDDVVCCFQNSESGSTTFSAKCFLGGHQAVFNVRADNSFQLNVD